MKINEFLTHDKISLKYACSTEAENWVVLILPFGVEVELAQSFFSHFESQFNVLTWQSRSILEGADYFLRENELCVENHTSDLFALMEFLQIKSARLVGYCSGAGIALNAGNRDPSKFERLSLVNGEYALVNEPECMTQHSYDIDGVLPAAAASKDVAGFVARSLQFQHVEGVPEGIYLAYSKAHYLYRYAQNYCEYKSIDFLNLARRLSIATQVITGHLDLQSHYEGSIRINNLIPNSELFIDHQGDHYEILRDNSLCLEKIKHFMT